MMHKLNHMKLLRVYYYISLCIVLTLLVSAGVAFSKEGLRLPPATGVSYSGLDIDYGELAKVINQFRATRGLNGLNLNEELQSAAMTHAIDMVVRLYYDHVDPDGLFPQDRIREFGYEPIFWGESMGAVAFNKWIDPAEAIGVIIESLMGSANENGKEGAPILNPFLRDVGFFAVAAQIDLFEPWKYVYVLVMDFGTKEDALCNEDSELDSSTTFGVAGHVYQDLNGNGRFDFREGVSGVEIQVTGPIGIYGPSDPVNWIKDVVDGCFALALRPGAYRLDVYKDGALLSTVTFSLDGTNCPLELSIPVF